MEVYVITEKGLQKFASWLKKEERCGGTVEKYLRDVRALRDWLQKRTVTKERVSLWKKFLLEQNYAPVTVNSMLAAANRFFECMGWEKCRVKYLKIQRRIFRESRREITKKDYEKLLKTAKCRSQNRLALLLETLASTGVRVSEVRFITVEAAKNGFAEISLKGKLRRVFLPKKLCRKLIKYAQKQKTAFGEIFITKCGKILGRKQIWAELKALAAKAGVEPSKVFPHNLRHLFAVNFYKICRDITKLADVLGHTSLETTRIYLVTAGSEHERLIERLGFVT